MARITYERAVKCKRCGEISVSIDRFQSYVLCQNCGEHIANLDIKNRELELTENADIVTVKVTHKLFKDIYEEVPQ